LAPDTRDDVVSQCHVQLDPDANRDFCDRVLGGLCCQGRDIQTASATLPRQIAIIKQSGCPLADERTEVLPIHLWQQIETNLDVRTAAASDVIVIFMTLLMLIAERMAGLTQQMR
jgi:hypothetical protein